MPKGSELAIIPIEVGEEVSTVVVDEVPQDRARGWKHRNIEVKSRGEDVAQVTYREDKY